MPVVCTRKLPRSQQQITHGELPGSRAGRSSLWAPWGHGPQLTIRWLPTVESGGAEDRRRALFAPPLPGDEPRHLK
ncbi:MAG: hypothetical protein H0V17_26090 [Deltaproteobacteria bacterium]|nr:hypothetical protein [Deltaproteobacteria bacterium]